MATSEQMTKTPTKRKAQLKFHGYAFLGPPGAVLISIVVPLTVYICAFVCNDISGCPAPSLLHPSRLNWSTLAEEVAWPGLTGLFSLRVMLWTLAYYGLLLALHALLPGQFAQGVKMANGARLNYKFNTFATSIVILLSAALGTLIQGVDFALWPFIWNNYIQLVTSNLLMAIFLATYCYIRSFEVQPGGTDKRILASGGISGNMLYDWFIGRELNPRVTLPLVGEIDIKAFCELCPGMLGYMLLDCAFIAHQYKLYGHVSDSNLLVTAFQMFYTLDGSYMEPAILTTMDIMQDGFGFMLAVGDLVWLPFFYSTQARYLAVHPVHLGVQGIALVLGVQLLGYYLFRSANNEKNRFRTNPNDPRVAHLKYMTTKSGSRLLVSGWWGTARHINYLGDWIMGWSYALPTGVAGYIITQAGGVHRPISSPATSTFTMNLAADNGSQRQVLPGDARGYGIIITYLYLIYFVILLVHRERRDEEKCSAKYGADWEEYKRRVKWRIVPYVY